MKILKGFTLIELLIYTGIIAVFLTVLTNIFLSILEAQQQAATASATDIDGRFLLTRLAYDIRRAGSVSTPASAGLTSSNLVLNTHSYAVSNGILYIDGAQPLTSPGSSISAFSITRLGNPSGQPTLSIDFTLTSGQTSQDYHFSVGLRQL